MLIKSDHKLVTHGPYRWVRHPLYTVSLLMLFSLGVVAANWFILTYCTVGLVIFRFMVIPVEEQQLLGSFGDEYREYLRRTGALIPRLFRCPSRQPSCPIRPV